MQVEAAGALCNLVMELSPARHALLSHGGVARLTAAATAGLGTPRPRQGAALTHGSAAAAAAAEGLDAVGAAEKQQLVELRLHALWALRNLVYRSDVTVRKAVSAVGAACWIVHTASLNGVRSRLIAG